MTDCFDANCQQDCMNRGSAEGTQALEAMLMCFEVECAQIEDQEAFQRCAQQNCGWEIDVCLSGADPGCVPEDDYVVRPRRTVPLGGRCQQDSECVQGFCLSIFRIGDGHCTAECRVDGDCADYDEQWGEFSCLDLGGAPLCIRTCEQGGCPDDMFCVDDIDLGDGRVPELHDLCVDTGRLGCDSHADCEAGCGDCVILGFDKYAQEGDAAPTICFPHAGMGEIPPGEQCTPGLADAEADCRADADCEDALGPEYYCDVDDETCRPLPELSCRGDLYCIWPGACSAPCASDEHCPDDMACAQFVFSQHDNDTPDLDCDDPSGVGTLCVPLGGSGLDCAADRDCADDEVCHLFDDFTGQRVSRCADAWGEHEARLPGEACGDDPHTPDVDEGELIGDVSCASGFCLRSGYCSAACREDADCPQDAGQPWVCLHEHLGPDGDQRGLCLPTQDCVRDADCERAGESCQIYIDGDQLRTLCVYDLDNGPGELANGAACDPALDEDPCGVDPAERCLSGRCGDDERCSAVCHEDVDCPGEEWLCSAFPFQVNGEDGDEGVEPIWDLAALCVHFPGSRQACMEAGACPEGEACQVMFNRQGAAEPLCTTVGDDLTAHGEPCADSDECRSGYCLPNPDAELPGQCVPVCMDDGGCPGDGELVCRELEIPGAAGGAAPVMMCQWPLEDPPEEEPVEEEPQQ